MEGFLHCCILLLTTSSVWAAVVKEGGITAVNSIIYLPQNTGKLIDLHMFTLNPSNLSVTYLLLQLPARGEVFTYLATGNVPQGNQICCPPLILESGKLYFVPSPNEYAQIYGVITFAVLQTSMVSSDMSRMSSLWSSADLQLNVSQTNEAPFTGAAGGMLYFDGLDDFAVVRTDSFPTDRFTISLWLKSERTRPLQTVFTLFSTAAGRELELSDTMDLRVLRGADQATASAGIFLADGRWHFVAVTWAYGYVKLIVDGEVQISTAVEKPAIHSPKSTH